MAYNLSLWYVENFHLILLLCIKMNSVILYFCTAFLAVFCLPCLAEASDKMPSNTENFIKDLAAILSVKRRKRVTIKSCREFFASLQSPVNLGVRQL